MFNFPKHTHTHKFTHLPLFCCPPTPPNQHTQKTHKLSVFLMANRTDMSEEGGGLKWASISLCQVYNASPGVHKQTDQSEKERQTGILGERCVREKRVTQQSLWLKLLCSWLSAILEIWLWFYACVYVYIYIQYSRFMTDNHPSASPDFFHFATLEAMLE